LALGREREAELWAVRGQAQELEWRMVATVGLTEGSIEQGPR